MAHYGVIDRLGQVGLEPVSGGQAVAVGVTTSDLESGQELKTENAGKD